MIRPACSLRERFMRNNIAYRNDIRSDNFYSQNPSDKDLFCGL